jgi:biotin carboxyl carrier protein
VGALQEVIEGIDLEVAEQALLSRQDDSEARNALAAKDTLLLRPIERLLANAHGLAGFLGRFDGVLWELRDGDAHFTENPLRFLAELYHYLNMDERPGTPPSEKIWDHDHDILRRGHDFYEEIAARSGARTWAEVSALFEGPPRDAICGGDEALWRACVAAHRGFQVGSEVLLLIPRIGIRAGFFDVSVNDELKVVFPERFLDPDAIAAHTKALAPHPKASADEIVTPMGGAFYPREAPHLPLLIDVGQHFEAGQPLFIIEVMKMFNKVPAPFAGTVTENLMKGQDGVVVHKGQVIFKIEPDERVTEETEEERAARRRDATLELLG